MTATPKNRFLQSQKAWENKINPDKTQIEADFPDQTSKEIIIGPRKLQSRMRGRA
jgi:hypothetical protein